MQNLKDRAKNLLHFGSEVKVLMNVIDENNAQSAIDCFRDMARNDSAYLLEQMIIFKDSPMFALSLSVLLCTADEEFLTANKENFYILLIDKTPGELLEFAEMMKSKVFGKGFGSRPQKLIRRVMESWTPSDLELFVTIEPKKVYSLVKIVHPRYRNQKSKIINSLLYSK